MERVLTACERRAIKRSDHPDQLLWAFWAAKETAYKAINKLYPDVSSSPGLYEVQLEEGAPAASGVVCTPKTEVPVRILFHPEYVHCFGGLTGSGHLDAIKWGVGTIDKNSGSVSERESQSARRLAASHIADILHCDPRDIVISRQNHHAKSDLPKVYVKGKPADMDISLSHDGRFAAFAVAGLRNSTANHFINYDRKI